MQATGRGFKSHWLQMNKTKKAKKNYIVLCVVKCDVCGASFGVKEEVFSKQDKYCCSTFCSKAFNSFRRKDRHLKNR